MVGEANQWLIINGLCLGGDQVTWCVVTSVSDRIRTFKSKCQVLSDYVVSKQLAGSCLSCSCCLPRLSLEAVGEGGARLVASAAVQL